MMLYWLSATPLLISFLVMIYYGILIAKSMDSTYSMPHRVLRLMPAIASVFAIYGVWWLYPGTDTWQFVFVFLAGLLNLPISIFAGRGLCNEK